MKQFEESQMYTLDGLGAAPIGIWKELWRITQTAQFTGKFVLETILVEHDDADQSFRLVATDTHRLLIGEMKRFKPEEGEEEANAWPLPAGRYAFACKPSRALGVQLIPIKYTLKADGSTIKFPNYRKAMPDPSTQRLIGRYSSAKNTLLLDEGVDINPHYLPRIKASYTLNSWTATGIAEQRDGGERRIEGLSYAFDATIGCWRLQYVVMSLQREEGEPAR